MKLSTYLPLLGAALFLGSQFASASSQGFTPAPLGDRSDAGVSYAFWDSFPNPSSPSPGPVAFTGDAPNTSDNEIFSGGLTLDGTVQTAALAASGLYIGSPADNRIYAGNTNGDPGNFSLQINGTATSSIHHFVLQLKFTGPANPATFFNVTLTGQAAPTTSVFTFLEGATPYSVVSYYWQDTNITASSAIQVNITSSAPSHTVIEAVSVDAVPEPTIGLALAAAAGFLGFRRNRKS